jgi:hypothetical protein
MHVAALAERQVRLHVLSGGSDFKGCSKVSGIAVGSRTPPSSASRELMMANRRRPSSIVVSHKPGICRHALERRRHCRKHPYQVVAGQSDQRRGEPEVIAERCRIRYRTIFSVGGGDRFL